MLRWVSAAVLVVCSSPGHALAGACARPQIPTVALTPTGTALAKGGGVVMTGEDSAKRPAWSFVRGKDKRPAKARVIGPGLWVFEPPADGAWTLADDKGAKKIDVSHAAADPSALAAPKIAAAKYDSSTGRRGTSTSVTITVTGPLPADAMALVVLDEKDAVRSFGNPQRGDASQKSIDIGVYYTGSCTVLPNGTVGTEGGDKVKLAWIDSSGRMSPATAVIVKAEKPTVVPGGM